MKEGVRVKEEAKYGGKMKLYERRGKKLCLRKITRKGRRCARGRWIGTRV